MKIPKRPWSKWDGYSKYKTKNCESCNFYRKIENEELCGWGSAFQYLDKSRRSKKCGIRNKTPPKNSSAVYLDEVIRELKNGNN